MTTKQSMKRIQQLADAWSECGGMPSNSLADHLRRVVRLIELCPWITEEQAEIIIGVDGNGKPVKLPKDMSRAK